MTLGLVEGGWWRVVGGGRLVEGGWWREIGHDIR